MGLCGSCVKVVESGMAEFEVQSEAEITRNELGLVWNKFVEYGVENPQTESEIRELIEENEATCLYNPLQKEIALEVMKVIDFGVMLAREEGGLVSEIFTEVPIELTNEKLILKTFMGMDDRYVRKTGGKIKASANSLINGGRVSLTIAGMDYEQRRLVGRTFSEHLDDQLIIDLIFGTGEEYGHFCFYQAKPGEKVSYALREYMVYERESGKFEVFRDLGTSLIAYHSSILERRAMIWKAALARRYFPSLFPSFISHMAEIAAAKI